MAKYEWIPVEKKVGDTTLKLVQVSEMTLGDLFVETIRWIFYIEIFFVTIGMLLGWHK